MRKEGEGEEEESQLSTQKSAESETFESIRETESEDVFEDLTIDGGSDMNLGDKKAEGEAEEITEALDDLILGNVEGAERFEQSSRDDQGLGESGGKGEEGLSRSSTPTQVPLGFPSHLLPSSPPLDSILCHGCGRANEPDSNFCSKCGTPLSSKSQEPQFEADHYQRPEFFSQPHNSYPDPSNLEPLSGSQPSFPSHYYSPFASSQVPILAISI